MGTKFVPKIFFIRCIDCSALSLLSPKFSDNFPFFPLYRGKGGGDKILDFVPFLSPFCPRGVKNRPFLPIHRKGDKIGKYIACDGFRDLTTVFLCYIIIYFTKK